MDNHQLLRIRESGQIGNVGFWRKQEQQQKLLNTHENGQTYILRGGWSDLHTLLSLDSAFDNAIKPNFSHNSIGKITFHMSLEL